MKVHKSYIVKPKPDICLWVIRPCNEKKHDISCGLPRHNCASHSFFFDNWSRITLGLFFAMIQVPSIFVGETFARFVMVLMWHAWGWTYQFIITENVTSSSYSELFAIHVHTMLAVNRTSIHVNRVPIKQHGAKTLEWRHNERDSVSNHQPRDCLLNRLFRRRSKKASKLRVTGPCAGITPVIGELPTQMASNWENVCIWWCHHEMNIMEIRRIKSGVQGVWTNISGWVGVGVVGGRGRSSTTREALLWCII